MVTRHKHWQRRLQALAAEFIGQKFEWGRTDCAILAVRAFDAITGGGLTHAYAGQYRNRFGALRFQRRYQVDIERVLRESGCIEVPAAEVEPGDFLIARAPGLPYPAAHVVYGDKALSSWSDTPFKAGTLPGWVDWCLTAKLLAQPSIIALRVPSADMQTSAL